MPDMDVMVAAMIVAVMLWAWKPSRSRNPRRNRQTVIAAQPGKHRGRRKPEWVVREVLGLKACSPELGVRKLADCFNRRFALARQMTVGHSYVAELLRRREAEWQAIRKDIKQRVPGPMPRNRIWALDLTGKADLTGRQRMILGVIDHGSHACLRLSDLSEKSSLTILRELIDAFRRVGLTRIIRTDKEACFTSRTMRLALRMLGIRLQHIDLHCPWQNGRIERLFGTLKSVLDRIAVIDGDDLGGKLIEFRAWYNHVRPHQHLQQMTPAEVWEQRAKSRKRPSYFSAWDGMLSGWHFPP